MSKALKVILFIIVTLALLFFGVNYLGGVNFFSPSKRYYGLYSNVDELAISAPVLISGYTVGRVSNVSILQDRGNQVLVEITIDSEITLGDSAMATLSADFLGKKSIILSVGNIMRPLQGGDTLHTKIASGLLNTLTEQAAPVASSIQVTLRNMDLTLETLKSTGARIDSLGVHLQPVIDGLHDMPTLIKGFIVQTNSRVAEVSGDVSTSLRYAQPMIKNLSAFSDSLARLELSKTLEETQRTIKSINTTLIKTSQSTNTIGKLLNEDSLYISINTLIRRLDSLAAHLNNNPRHFFAPLGRSEEQIRRENAKRRAKEAQRKETP